MPGSLQWVEVLDRIIGKFSEMSEAMFSFGLAAVNFEVENA
jgi:hypothetical protein